MRNIEVKARVDDPAAFEAKLQRSAARFVESFAQRDVFFRVPQGRLKLRFLDDSAELIFYQRSNDAAVRGSDYQREIVKDGEGLCRILETALGTCGEVRKQRRLYRLDNIRIHVDDVDGLGDYMEVEAVIDAQHTEAACLQAAQQLLQELGIAETDYEATAYLDLLQTRRD